MSEELKPCPFCGSGDTSTSYATNTDGVVSSRFVECEACAAMGPAVDDDAQAIAAWNRRTPDAGKAEPVAWRGEAIPFACPYPELGRSGAPYAYNIDPGAGSAMDRLQRDWPSKLQVMDLRERDGRVTALYPAHPQPPQPSPGVGEAVERLTCALRRARAFIDACAVEGELTPNDQAENPCELVLAIEAALSHQTSARVEAEEGEHQLTLSDGSTAWCSAKAWKWFQEWAVRLEKEHSRAEQAEARIATLEAERKSDRAALREIASRRQTNAWDEVEAWELQDIARQRLSAHQKGGE